MTRVTTHADLFIPDVSDGYPTEEWLAVLSSPLGVSQADADRLLTETLRLACQEISCCSYEAIPADDDLGEPVTRIFFSTGGWSGAEALIDALLGQFWVRHRHVQWNRGGHYIFEVPRA